MVKKNAVGLKVIFGAPSWSWSLVKGLAVLFPLPPLFVISKFENSHSFIWDPEFCHAEAYISTPIFRPKSLNQKYEITQAQIFDLIKGNKWFSQDMWICLTSINTTNVLSCDVH